MAEGSSPDSGGPKCGEAPSHHRTDDRFCSSRRPAQTRQLPPLRVGKATARLAGDAATGRPAPKRPLVAAGCRSRRGVPQRALPTSFRPGEALVQVKDDFLHKVLNVAVLGASDEHHPVMGEALHGGFLPDLGPVPQLQLHLDGALRGERRGVPGERPRKRSWSRKNRPIAGGGGTRTKNGTINSAKGTKIERHPRHPATKTRPCRRGRRRALAATGGTRGGAAAGPRCRPANAGSGGRCQGLIVTSPGASALGVPGAGAGTWLRRHPLPPCGYVRAPCRYRQRRVGSGRQEKRRAKRNPPSRQPLPGGENRRHRAARSADGGSPVLTELAMLGAPAALGRSLLPPAPTPQR